MAYTSYRLEVAYRMRLRGYNHENLEDDFWIPSDKFEFPFVLQKQVGTRRCGWPWARYDVPVYKLVRAVADLDDAMVAIRQDVEDHISLHRAKALAEAKRSNFRGPRDIDVVVTIAADPSDDRIIINPR